jgi:hypothetical protein
MWVLASRPGHFTPGESAKWAQSQSGSFEKEKNLLAPPGTEPRFLGRRTSIVITTYYVFLHL